MVVSRSPKFTVCSAVLLRKAAFPMVVQAVRLSGPVRTLQPLKAFSPIDVHVLPSVPSVARAVQSWKTVAPIVVTLAGIFIPVIAVQP